LVANSAGAEALAGDGFESGEFNRLNALLLAVASNGARERMGREPFQRAGDLRHFGFAARRKAFHFLDAQFAGGERGGLC
jgi:hypothetical protein